MLNERQIEWEKRARFELSQIEQAYSHLLTRQHIPLFAYNIWQYTKLDNDIVTIRA